MGLHSARRQEQPVRDLRIRQTLTDQVDNCRLGRREAGPTAARPPPMARQPMVRRRHRPQTALSYQTQVKTGSPELRI